MFYVLLSFVEPTSDSVSLITVGLIMIMASGTEIGSTLFGGAIKTQEWQESANNLQLIFVHCMFFVGSIVGGFNAGYFIDSIGRRPTLVWIIMTIIPDTSLFVNPIFIVLFQKIAFGSLTLNTVLLILASNKVVAIIIARMCSGYTFGMLYVTLIVMASEIAPFCNRGLFTSLVYFFAFLGAFIFALVNMFHKFHNVNQTIGWISLGLLIGAVPFYYFFALETPHYHIMKNNHSDGLQTLLYIRAERVISNSLKQEFVDIQQSVARDLQSQGDGLLPVLKNRNFYILALLRLPVLFSFNQLLNRSQLDIIVSGIGPYSKYLFQPLLLAGIHVIIGLIAMFSLDRLKRLYFFTIPLLIASIMIIVTGATLSIPKFNPFVFIILFEIFHGLGIGMTVDVVTAEGFPLQKKGIAISMLNGLYMCGHVILIIVSIYVELNTLTNQVILCVHGGLLLICGLIRLPDTRQQSLQEARRLININFLGWTF